MTVVGPQSSLATRRELPQLIAASGVSSKRTPRNLATSRPDAAINEGSSHWIRGRSSSVEWHEFEGTPVGGSDRSEVALIECEHSPRTVAFCEYDHRRVCEPDAVIPVSVDHGHGLYDIVGAEVGQVIRT